MVLKQQLAGVKILPSSSSLLSLHHRPFVLSVHPILCRYNVGMAYLLLYGLTPLNTCHGGHAKTDSVANHHIDRNDGILYDVILIHVQSGLI